MSVKDNRADVSEKKEDDGASASKSKKSSSLFTWALALFGTAVGAGILFLPISAGSFGFWPLVIMTVLIGPIVFFFHRTYSRIISVSGETGKDILETVAHLTGRKRGLLVAVLYWFSIYPTVLIYGVSVTNTANSFIVNQLNGPEIARPLIAVACVGVLTAVFTFGKKTVLKVSNALVYPLVISLAAVSVYLIPRWDFASFRSFEPDTSIVAGVLLMLPVLIFSMSHMAAISQLVLDMQRDHADDLDKRVSQVDLVAVAMLVSFTMIFTWSCALAMGAEGLMEADAENLPVLPYFANVTDTPFMAYLAPIVTLCAIATSYFGHMLGTEESFRYMFRAFAPDTAEKVKPQTMSYAIYAFVFVTATAVAILNPSVLDMISIIGGLILAFIVGMLPFLVFATTKHMRKYARKPETILVFCIGVILAGTTIWDLLT
ncbi:MAG: aromatic amino acid transport family protein [Corynebacterium sp.]|nr:aromatic amino acid transport family protein [Corynebacterium sp.]